jgi:hypothetical protein
LLETLSDLAAVVPADAREALVEQADAVVRAARRAIDDPFDLEAVERLATWARVDARAAGGAGVGAPGGSAE